MKIRLHSSAKQDLIEGSHFYENQQQTIGQYFLDSLVISAGIHQKSHKQLYRMLSKRFPFAIYYKVTHEHIQVEAILDCRKKPAWIRKRLLIE